MLAQNYPTLLAQTRPVYGLDVAVGYQFEGSGLEWVPMSLAVFITCECVVFIDLARTTWKSSMLYPLR